MAKIFGGLTTSYRNGQFWVIDTATGLDVETFSPFHTIAEAKAAIGSKWEDSTWKENITLDL